MPLNDSHVSRMHLFVSRRGDQIWIEDKNSSNGTFINGSKIKQGTPINVVPSDRIQLGRSEFILVIDLEIEKAPEPEPVVTAAPNHENTVFMPAPNMAPGQAEKILNEAKHKAAQIIFEGESQAEKRTQAIYQKARDAQAQAEIFHQTRIAEAHKEADAILSDFQSQGRQLLQEARNMAQGLRDEVDAYVQTLREKARRDAEEVVAEGALKAEKMKTEALEAARATVQAENETKLRLAQEEADNIIALAKKQAELVQDDLKRQSEELAKATEALQHLKSEQDEIEKRLEALKSEEAHTKQSLQDEVNSLKKSIEEDKAQVDELNASIKEATAKSKEAEEQFKKLQEKQAHLTMGIDDLEAKKSSLLKEHDAQKILLSEKFEKEKSQLAKSEEQRAEEMRLETSKRLQKLEQELLEEVMAKKATMIKEIHIQIEREVVKEMEPAQWNKISANVLDQIKEAVEGRVANISQTSATKVAPANLVKKRQSEKMRWAAAGLFMGAVLCLTGQLALEKVRSDKNPLQTRADNEAKQRQEDLERRKFNPRQTAEIRDTYTDSVIYTSNFSEVYLDRQFQERLYKATAQYLLKTWRIDEDKSLQVLSAANALVKELQERRSKIHPDYIKDGIEKMRVFESQTVARMKDLLGSEVRLESFRRFEKNFYKEEVDRRRTTMTH